MIDAAAELKRRQEAARKKSEIQDNGVLEQTEIAKIIAFNNGAGIRYDVFRKPEGKQWAMVAQGYNRELAFKIYQRVKDNEPLFRIS